MRMSWGNFDGELGPSHSIPTQTHSVTSAHRRCIVFTRQRFCRALPLCIALVVVVLIGACGGGADAPFPITPPTPTTPTTPATSTTPTPTTPTPTTPTPTTPTPTTPTPTTPTPTTPTPTTPTPTVLVVLAGDAQASTPGAALPVKLLVAVRDVSGVGVAAITATFSVDSGNGSLTSTTVTRRMTESARTMMYGTVLEKTSKRPIGRDSSAVLYARSWVYDCCTHIIRITARWHWITTP